MLLSLQPLILWVYLWLAGVGLCILCVCVCLLVFCVRVDDLISSLSVYMHVISSKIICRIMQIVFIHLYFSMLFLRMTSTSWLFYLNQGCLHIIFLVVVSEYLWLSALLPPELWGQVQSLPTIFFGFINNFYLLKCRKEECHLIPPYNWLVIGKLSHAIPNFC